MMGEYQQLLDPMTRELSGTIKRTADGAFIPDDGANRDRAEYEEWVAAGNTPDAPEPLPEPAGFGAVDPITERIEALEARVTALERRK